MKQALSLLVAIAAAFLLAHAHLGYGRVYEIGYGAFTLMAILISLTFLWLWRERATPLALGMAFGWAGAAFVMGWWWAFNLFGKPPAMLDSPVLFLFLSFYFVGAILHFAVIESSLGLKQGAFVLPVAAAVALSVLASLAI